MVSLLVGFGFSLSINISMKNFSSIVVGNATLAEPLVAQFLGIILNLDHYPGILTYLGGAITVGGLYLLGRDS